MSQEDETTPTASAPAVPATSARASGRGDATPTPRAPREDLRTSPARAGPVYIERDTMRELRGCVLSKVSTANSVAGL